MKFLESLVYQNLDTGRSVEFSARRSVTPYWWAEADGLDGLTANVYTSKGSGQDGETYISSNLAIRYISITTRMHSNVEQAKRDLLSVCNPKSNGRLVYRFGDFVAYIPARIETAPVFTRENYPAASLYFVCPNPFWREGDGELQQCAQIAQWVGKLEFPVELPESGWEIEQRSPSLIVNVFNSGDVETGLTIEFKALATNSNPSLVNVGTQEQLNITQAMSAGDVIRVKTGYREKSCVLISGGVETNIFNSFSGTWLQLAPGDNLLRYDATDTDNMDVTLYYDALLLGV